ncbi:hypothetical protein ARSEF4850_005352 [Beauveria asiatica]
MDVLPRAPAKEATPKLVNAETDSTSSKEKQLTATVADFEPEQEKPNPIEYALARQQLIVAYLAIFILLFVQELTSGIFRVLNPYVTSEFARQSLTATTSVVSSIVSAVINLPVAKLIELWGRRCSSASSSWRRAAPSRPIAPLKHLAGPNSMADALIIELALQSLAFRGGGSDGVELQ